MFARTVKHELKVTASALPVHQGRRRFLKSGTAIGRHWRSARAEEARAREGEFPPSR